MILYNFVGQLWIPRSIEVNTHNRKMREVLYYCPVVDHVRCSQVFSIDDRGGNSFALTNYYPAPLEQSLFLGLPVEITTVNLRRYHIQDTHTVRLDWEDQTDTSFDVLKLCYHVVP